MMPIDLVVALALALADASETYQELAKELGISPSTAFDAVQSLQRTGMLRAGSRQPNNTELRNFLVHGAKHAFPALLGREARGVPTAHSGPVLKDLFDSSKPIVWPSPKGTVRGTSLTPLYPKAVELPKRSPRLYQVLALIDALRVGQARERNAARNAIDELLGVTAGE
jgi:DNA-binding Lrp family transcriptional regulator